MRDIYLRVDVVMAPPHQANRANKLHKDWPVPGVEQKRNGESWMDYTVRLSGKLAEMFPLQPGSPIEQQAPGNLAHRMFDAISRAKKERRDGGDAEDTLKALVRVLSGMMSFTGGPQAAVMALRTKSTAPEAAQLLGTYEEATAALRGRFNLKAFTDALHAAFRTDDEMGNASAGRSGERFGALVRLLEGLVGFSDVSGSGPKEALAAMKAPYRTPEAAELGQKYDQARAAIGGEFQLDGFLLKLQAAFRTDDEMGLDGESARCHEELESYKIALGYLTDLFKVVNEWPRGACDALRVLAPNAQNRPDAAGLVTIYRIANEALAKLAEGHRVDMGAFLQTMWAVCPQQTETMLTDLIDGDLAGLPDRARGLLERVCRPGQHDQRVANTCDFLKKIIDTDDVIAALIGGRGANAYADRPAHVRADVLMTGLDSLLDRNDLSPEASSLVASVGAIAKQRERYRIFALAAPEALVATLGPRDVLEAELGAKGVADLVPVVGRLRSSAELYASVRKVFEDTRAAVEHSPVNDTRAAVRADLKVFCGSIRAVSDAIEAAHPTDEDMLRWFYERTRLVCRVYEVADYLRDPASSIIGEESSARTEQVNKTRAVLQEKDPFVLEWFDEITNKLAPLHDGIRGKHRLVSAIGLLTGPDPPPSEDYRRVELLRNAFSRLTELKIASNAARGTGFDALLASIHAVYEQCRLYKNGLINLPSMALLNDAKARENSLRGLLGDEEYVAFVGAYDKLMRVLAPTGPPPPAVTNGISPPEDVELGVEMHTEAWTSKARERIDGNIARVLPMTAQLFRNWARAADEERRGLYELFDPSGAPDPAAAQRILLSAPGSRAPLSGLLRRFVDWSEDFYRKLATARSRLVPDDASARLAWSGLVTQIVEAIDTSAERLRRATLVAGPTLSQLVEAVERGEEANRRVVALVCANVPAPAAVGPQDAIRRMEHLYAETGLESIDEIVDDHGKLIEDIDEILRNLENYGFEKTSCSGVERDADCAIRFLQTNSVRFLASGGVLEKIGEAFDARGVVLPVAIRALKEHIRSRVGDGDGFKRRCEDLAAKLELCAGMAHGSDRDLVDLRNTLYSQQGLWKFNYKVLPEEIKFLLESARNVRGQCLTGLRKGDADTPLSPETSLLTLTPQVLNARGGAPVALECPGLVRLVCGTDMRTAADAEAHVNALLIETGQNNVADATALLRELDGEVAMGYGATEKLDTRSTVDLLKRNRNSYHDARKVVGYLRTTVSRAVQPPTLTTQTASIAMQHVVAVSDGIVRISGDLESAARMLFDDTPSAPPQNPGPVPLMLTQLRAVTSRTTAGAARLRDRLTGALGVDPAQTVESLVGVASRSLANGGQHLADLTTQKKELENRLKESDANMLESQRRLRETKGRLGEADASLKRVSDDLKTCRDAGAGAGNAERVRGLEASLADCRAARESSAEEVARGREEWSRMYRDHKMWTRQLAKVMEAEYEGARAADAERLRKGVEKERALREQIARLKEGRVERKVAEAQLGRLRRVRDGRGAIYRAEGDLGVATARYVRDHGGSHVFVFGPSSLAPDLARLPAATLIDEGSLGPPRWAWSQSDMLFVGLSGLTPDVMNRLEDEGRRARVSFLLTDRDVDRLSKKERRGLRNLAAGRKRT
jgi:hypothetical protein